MNNFELIDDLILDQKDLVLITGGKGVIVKPSGLNCGSNCGRGCYGCSSSTVGK